MRQEYKITPLFTYNGNRDNYLFIGTFPKNERENNSIMYIITTGLIHWSTYKSNRGSH